MDILGIGIWEILLILALAFVILGPQDMATLGRKAGKALRSWLRSDEYRELKRTQNALTNLPRKLMDESALDKNLISPWAAPGKAEQNRPVEMAKTVDEPDSNLTAKTDLDDGLGAWSNPGDSPNEKYKAMIADIKQASAREKDDTKIDQPGTKSATSEFET